MRMLEERAHIQQNLAQRQTGTGGASLRPRFQEQAEAAAKDVALLREILERL